MNKKINNNKSQLQDSGFKAEIGLVSGHSFPAEVLTLSAWVSTAFSGFLLSPKNMLVGELTRIKLVNEKNK